MNNNRFIFYSEQKDPYSNDNKIKCKWLDRLLKCYKNYAEGDMNGDLMLDNGTVIPAHEFDVMTSRSGGPGGQHVNTSDTRVTVRWNIKNSPSLDEGQKELLLTKLASSLTGDGELIVHSSVSRSQQTNKQKAFQVLVEKVNKALLVPKKRKKTRISSAVKAKRLQEKSQRGLLKKTRSKKLYDE